MEDKRTWSSKARPPRIGDVVRFDAWADSVRITATDGYPDTHCRTDGNYGQIVMRVNWDGGRYEIIESATEQTTAGAAHYVKGDLQVIDVIEKWDLNRNLAQTVAYVLRCEHKGNKNLDLEKAIDYLWRERYGTWATLPERTKK